VKEVSAPRHAIWIAIYAGWVAFGVLLIALFPNHFWLVFVPWAFLSWVLMFARLERRRRLQRRTETESGT